MKIEPLVIGDLTARVPVMQGGMGVGVSLSGLAGAVAAEGGIGIISTAQIGYRDANFDLEPIACNLRAIQTEIDKARQIAKGGIVGVNIMVATQKYEEYVKAAAGSRRGFNCFGCRSACGCAQSMYRGVEQNWCRSCPVSNPFRSL